MGHTYTNLTTHIIFSTKDRYITNQEKHHRRVSFQEEFRKLLDAHGIAYDERSLTDCKGCSALSGLGGRWGA